MYSRGLRFPPYVALYHGNKLDNATQNTVGIAVHTNAFLSSRMSDTVPLGVSGSRPGISSRYHVTRPASIYIEVNSLLLTYTEGVIICYFTKNVYLPFFPEAQYDTAMQQERISNED